MRIVGLGRGFFALASAGLALMCLAYGDFDPMWHSLDGLPGREVCIDGFALLVLAAAAGLYFSRIALPSLWVVGAYSAIWAVIAAPKIFSNPLSFGAWYGLCEGLSVLAGAGILYALLRWESGPPIAIQRGVRAAQALFGLMCIFYGASHFAYADYTAAMVPGWLPGRLTLAYLTGLGHIGAGLGLIVGVLPGLAAILEAAMMSLFGLLVWVPSFFVQPTPNWATPPQNQWSELVVTAILAASAWVVAISLRDRIWTVGRRSRLPVL